MSDFEEQKEKKLLRLYTALDKIILIGIYLFLAIPIVIWLWFWFKWYVSIPCIGATLYGFSIFTKNIKVKTLVDYKKIFNVKNLAIASVLILGLNLLSGAGGLMFQNWDYHSRNAVLHDLVERKWPVKFQFAPGSSEAEFIGSDEGLLSYYLAWFLPAAAIGKVAKSFAVASIFSFFWLYFGVMGVCYLIFRFFKRSKLWILLILLAITGVDCIAYTLDRLIIKNQFVLPNMINYLDTPLQMFAFHGILTHWFWVFNQAIPIWLVTLLFLDNKKLDLAGLYLSIALPYAPFPAIGLFLIMLKEVFINLRQTGAKKTFLGLLNLKNIIPVLGIIPILILYRQNSSTFGLTFSRPYVSFQEYLISYIIYLVFEVLIFLIILTKKNKGVVLYSILLLTFLPLFYLGGGVDFGNRTTIPVMILLFIEVVNFCLEEQKNKYRLWGLRIILLLSLPTSITEINRSLNYTYHKPPTSYRLESDSYKTLADFEHNESKVFIKNFITKYPKNQNFFTRYILK